MLEKPRFPENTVVSCDIKLLPTSPILNMFKWIKQLFKKDNSYYAGLPFARGRSESLPCAAMQSEIIANELQEKEQSFSEPVNLIVESLKEEGRWTWEYQQHPQHAAISSGHYLLVDNITQTKFDLMYLYNSLIGCEWASREENKHMASEMFKMIKTKEKEQKEEEKKGRRAELTTLYKEASNAE